MKTKLLVGFLVLWLLAVGYFRRDISMVREQGTIFYNPGVRPVEVAPR